MSNEQHADFEYEAPPLVPPKQLFELSHLKIFLAPGPKLGQSSEVQSRDQRCQDQWYSHQGGEPFSIESYFNCVRNRLVLAGGDYQ